MKQEVNTREKQWTDAAQINDGCRDIEAAILAIKKNYESRKDGHLDRIIVAKHRIVLNPSNSPLMHSAPYCTESGLRKLEREDIKNMRWGRHGCTHPNELDFYGSNLAQEG